MASLRVEGPRWPSASRTDEVVATIRAALDRDRSLNVRLAADEARNTKTVIHRISVETPRGNLLSTSQITRPMSKKESRHLISQELLNRAASLIFFFFLRREITRGKTCVSEYNPEPKRIHLTTAHSQFTSADESTQEQMESQFSAHRSFFLLDLFAENLCHHHRHAIILFTYSS